MHPPKLLHLFVVVVDVVVFYLNHRLPNQTAEEIETTTTTTTAKKQNKTKTKKIGRGEVGGGEWEVGGRPGRKWKIHQVAN